MFWSGQGYFNNQEQSLSTLSQSDIADLVSFISGSGGKNVRLGDYVASTQQQPEIIVIFVEQQGQPTRDAYSFMGSFLDSAASSLVLPYVYPEASLSAAILNNEKADSKLVDKEDVLQYIEEHQTILSDGKTNIIVVRTNSADASLILAVEQRLTGTSYVLGHAADGMFCDGRKARMAPLNVLDGVVVERWYGGEYWPSDVWAGLIAMVILLILLAIGIGCMLELQTPTRWEKTKRTVREAN